MRSDKLFLAIALAATAAMAHGATKLTVTADGVNLDGTTLADGKLIADTTVSEIALNGGTLDLNGHNLTFSSSVGSKLSVDSTVATTVTNSGDGDPKTVKFELTGTPRFSANLFEPVIFTGNLKLELKGLSTSGNWIFGKDARDGNTHSGGTTLDGYYVSSGADIFDATKYSRFGGSSTMNNDFGNGPFTLKNGSMIVYTGPEDGIQTWSKLIAVNEDNNTYTNALRFENRMTYNGSVEVDAKSRLLLAAKNRYSVWEADFSKVDGWLGFSGEYSSSIQAKFTGTENVGFPNAHVQVFKPDGADQVYQLRLNATQNVPIEIGELSTADTITEATTNAVVMNVSGAARTLKIGSLGTDSAFYGNISANGSSGINLEKVGGGTFTLGGTNTYNLATTLTDGTIKIAGAGVMGNGGDIIFNGGVLAFAKDAIDVDYSSRITNSTAAAIKVSVDEDSTVVWRAALDSSNTQGLEKSGKGSLVLSELPKYTGKTVVEEGALTIPVNDTTLTAENFEVKSGAEITYVNNHTYQITDKLGTIGETATVNFLPNSSWRLWRCMAYPFGGADFKGTINFANKGISSTVDGIMNDTASVGNSNVVWGVTGEPDKDNTLLLYIQGNTGGTSKGYLGALRQTSDKGVISIYRNMPVIEIGNRADVASVLNGAWMERTTSGKTTAATIRKIGKGKLVLGTRFRAISINDTKLMNGNFTDNDKDGSVYYPTFQIVDGTFENNADLSTGFTVDLSEASTNVVLCGKGTWPESMTLPASYKVAAVDPVDGATPPTLDLDVDFSKATLANLPTADTVAALDTEKTYTIFTAKSISNWTAAVVAANKNGKWKVVQQGNRLVLKYAKASFVVILR